MIDVCVAIRTEKSVISSQLFHHSDFIMNSATKRCFTRNGIRYHVVVTGKGTLSDERIKRVLISHEGIARQWALETGEK